MTPAPSTTHGVTEDGLAYEDGSLTLRDGRELAWRWWGEEGGRPVLKLQGTPGSRFFRNYDPQVQLGLGVRYLMADRPGYGGSTRKPGRGIADFATTWPNCSTRTVLTGCPSWGRAAEARTHSP